MLPFFWNWPVGCNQQTGPHPIFSWGAQLVCTGYVATRMVDTWETWDFQMIANFVPNHFFEFTPNSLQNKPTAKRNMTERVFDSESFSIHWDPISTCADVSFCFFGDHVFGMCSLIWRCFWWNIFIYERERKSTRIWFIRVYAEIVWCRFVTWGLHTCREYIYRL